MLDKIIQNSIKNKLVVGLMVLGLIAWGIYSLNQLPIDAVPDITNNQVQILTSSPSNGAEDIERFVTFPIEQTMSTIPDIEEVRSFSRFGLSVVTIVFKDDVDVYWARQQVNERLQSAMNSIPAGMGVPAIAPLSTGLGEIYQYVIHTEKGYEKKYNATELRTIQDWIVRRQLLGVEGIADVSSFGGYLKQYEIALNPDKLRSMNISISEVFSAVQKNNQNTGGAYIDKKPNVYFIRSQGLIGSMEDIENCVIKRNSNGLPVLIKDVGKVQIGYATRYGAMTRNDEGEVVGAIVLMLKGANASKVISDVKERMEQIKKTLPKGIVIEPFLDRTKLVNNAIGTVTKNLAEGALIVIFILVLLLGNFRAGLIVASVIPLAMLFAISLMNLFGVSGNLMSLGAIDFGLIVDGAVIIVEATLHHLAIRKNKLTLSQNEMDSEVFSASSKIRNSAAFGELIILIVYLPILVLVGIEGKMFRPMAQTVSFAILGAFILSLTYVPMMSALFLSKKIQTKRTISDRLMSFFQKIYKPMLNFALRSKKLVLGITLSLFVLSLIIYKNLGAEFIPTLEEGDFAVETRVLLGSSLSQSIEASMKSAKVLKDNFPEVKEVVSKIGSGEIPTDPMPVEALDMMVLLKDKDEWTSASSREELAQKMQETLEKNIPGVTFGFQQPIQMRFNELITGVKQDVAIKIYGENLEKLSKYAKQVGKIVAKIKGAKDIYLEEIEGLSEIIIDFDREKIAQFGFNIEDANTAIRTAFAGEKAGLVFEGEKHFDLVVRLEKEDRSTIEDVENLFITNSSGNQIPLNQLATVSFKPGLNQIQRDDAKRRIIVGFNVRGRDVESIIEELKLKIDSEVQFEAGYYPKYGGTYENLKKASKRLSIAVPVALLLIFFLLYLTFKSAKYALLIFTAIPLSAIGGIFALWFRGMPFSISAGIGFIALFGVAVLNGIVLIGEFNRLKKSGLTDLKEIVVQGTSVRLRPVIMTALVASLGFLPMALSAGSGAEVQKPLATVVIGGLFTATLLTLLVLPILYIWFEKFNFKKIKNMKVISLIIVFLTFNSSFNAQVQMNSLEEIIQISLKNNEIIGIANLNMQQQTMLKKTSFEIPKTNVNMLYGQYNSSYRNDNSITISQSIPFPTVFKANSNIGNARIEESKLMLDVASNELIFRIKEVYYTLLFLHEKEKLIEQQDSIYTDFLRIANQHLKAGSGTLLEKANAETQLNAILNLKQQNNSEIEIFQSKLQNLMRSSEIPNLSKLNLPELKIESLLDTTILNNNPNLLAIRQQIEIASNQKKLTQAQSLPDITLGYFNQTLIGNQTINGEDVFFGANKRFQGVSFGLAIPIFYAPFRAKNQVAETNRQIAVMNSEKFHKDLQSHYQQVVQEYLRQKNNLEFYKNSALPNAAFILKTSQKSFQAGEINYSEFLLNIKEANTIFENHQHTLLQYDLSVISLEFLAGIK